MNTLRIVLILVGLWLGSMMLTSCAGEEGVCMGASPTDGAEPFGDEQKFSDGKNTVIMSNKIDPKAADYFLSQVDACSREIFSKLRIDSPFRDHLTYVLRDMAKHPSHCGKFEDATTTPTGLDGDQDQEDDDTAINEAVECGGVGVAYKYLTEWGIEALNKSVEEGKKSPTSDCLGADYSVIHELSHAIRSYTADFWWGAEEGMAELTTHALDRDRALDAMKRKSSLVVEGDLRPNEVMTLPPYDATNSWGIVYSDITLRSLGSNEAVLACTEKIVDLGGLGQVIEDSFVLDSCTTMSGLIVCLDSRGANRVHVRLYDTNGHLDAYTPDCTDDGLRSYDSGPPSIYLIDDGELLSAYRWEELIMTPYQEMTSDIVGWERDAMHPRMYTNAFCFWDLLRQKYGEDTLPSIMRDMQEFSKKHEDSPAGYSLFQTVIEKTGMSKSEARMVFDRHHMPVDDEQYPIGGICW